MSLESAILQWHLNQIIILPISQSVSFYQKNNFVSEALFSKTDVEANTHEFQFGIYPRPWFNLEKVGTSS